MGRVFRGPGGRCVRGGHAGRCLRATCHGVGATGTADAPNVRCATRVVDAMTRGRGSAMPAFGTWPLARMNAVATHLADLCAAAGWPAADVYAGNCSTCHGATGRGRRSAEGIRGPDIRCVSAHDLDEKVRRKHHSDSCAIVVQIFWPVTT